MLYLDINGRQLLLPGKTTAQVEHVSPLFANGVEDSFSLPVEVPAEGNEEVLGNVHVLPLAERPEAYEGAHLGHDGQPLFPGKLHVLSTTERSVRMTFIIDALVGKLRGVMLPEVVADEVIDLTDELLNQNMSLHQRPSYRNGGKCQFPMFLAPELYGDSNPDWVDRAQDYSEDSAYSVNDQIRFTTYDVVERTEVWRCNTATSAGENPLTHPAKWDKAQYGVVNAWDRVANQHHYNTVQGNFYTFVPWFYLKWVLKKAMAYLGYEATGAFMDDVRYDELQLPNLTTIDPQSAETQDYFFRVRQTNSVAWTPASGWQQFRIPGQAESPLPQQDPFNLWNPTTAQWECPTTGTFTFRIRVTVNVSISQWYQFRLMRADGTTRYWQAYTLPTEEWLNQSTIYTPRTVEALMSVTMNAGDVGDLFHFTVIQVNSPNAGGADPGAGVQFPNSLWPSNVYSNAQLAGWLETPSNVVMPPDTLIRADRHVPNVPLLDWIVALVDLYNLRIDLDQGSRRVVFNYRQSSLERPGTAENASSRMVGTTEIDLQRRITGYVLSTDIEKRDIGETGLEDRLEVMTEDDLPLPVRRGQTALAIATRAVYESTFQLGVYYWRRTGYLVPDVVVGEREGAIEVNSAMKPLHMVRITKDDRIYMVPLMEGGGTSNWFGVSNDQTEMFVCEFKKQRAYGDSGPARIPGARSWGYGWTDSDRSACTLELSRNDAFFQGVFQLHWKQWTEQLIASEPVTMDLLVDGPWLRGKSWISPLHIHGQNYLVERIPVEYGTGASPMVSSGAYLYRLMTPQPRDVRNVPIPFLCAGPGYGSFVAEAGALLTVQTTTGYITSRFFFDGSLSTATDGNDFPATGAGSHCLWVSDENGEKTGALVFLDDAASPQFRAFDLRGYDQLNTVFLASDLEEVLLPQESALTIMYLNGVGNSFATLDLSQQANLDELGVTFVGTALDFSGCPNLRVLNVNGGTLETVVAPGNAQLQSVVINDAALDQASVDALLLACNEGHLGGQFVVEGGTSASPSTSPAVNAKLAALSLNLWTILVN